MNKGETPIRFLSQVSIGYMFFFGGINIFCDENTMNKVRNLFAGDRHTHIYIKNQLCETNLKLSSANKINDHNRDSMYTKDNLHSISHVQ